MSSSGHVVINGKVYSLAAGAPKPAVKTIDGMTAARTAHLPPTPPKKAPVSRAPVNSQDVAKMRSKTLKRTAVVKPTTQPVQQQQIIKPTLAAPKSRIDRAATTERSPHVGKFSATPKVEPSAVAIQPKEEPSDILVHEPPVYEPEPPVSQPNLIDRKLQLTAIQEPSKPKRSFTFGAVAVPALAALMITAGVVTYFRLPQVSMRIAASRAGFNASLPDTPSGFTLSGPIVYEQGQVAVSYASNTDERDLTVSQTPSNLDSESLASGYLRTNNIEYQTYQVNGVDVFVYNGSQAMWVNGGIWYQLSGNSRLSTEQILSLVRSF